VRPDIAVIAPEANLGEGYNEMEEGDTHCFWWPVDVASNDLSRCYLPESVLFGEICYFFRTGSDLWMGLQKQVISCDGGVMRDPSEVLSDTSEVDRHLPGILIKIRVLSPLCTRIPSIDATTTKDIRKESKVRSPRYLPHELRRPYFHAQSLFTGRSSRTVGQKVTEVR
jgi:hypothetical protein